jgi:hypothetical protein
MVADAIDRAVSFLASAQTEDGHFRSMTGAANSESLSQVIIALSAAGIDPTSDNRFIKRNRNPLDVLNLYRIGDGRYAHTISSPLRENEISSRQALLALTAARQVMRYIALPDGDESFRPGMYELQ